MWRCCLSILAVCLSCAVAAPAWADASLKERFWRSDIATRLDALNHELADASPLGHDQLMVATYVPEQGALSEWDDETRLTLYHWDGGDAFSRMQFVSKAGESVPGRMAGWLFADLDGDREPEVLVMSQPVAPTGKVTTLVYRRSGPDASFSLVARRKDLGAAVRLDAQGLAYLYEVSHTGPWREERWAWTNGAPAVAATRDLLPTPLSTRTHP